MRYEQVVAEPAEPLLAMAGYKHHREIDGIKTRTVNNEKSARLEWIKPPVLINARLRRSQCSNDAPIDTKKSSSAT